MRVAIVAARGLGDGLLAMVLANAYADAGHEAVLFSSPLCSLSPWFPQVQICPFPLPESYLRVFCGFDLLIFSDHACIRDPLPLHISQIFLKESSFNTRKTMVENLEWVCKNKLGVQPTTGLHPVIPSHLIYRRYPQRVLIHPESTTHKKNWSPSRYLALASLLRSKGFEPVFCVSPKERPFWTTRVAPDRISLPYFASIDGLAAYLYESGGMIGNDSGVGHLASCLQIPSCSLFARRSYARLWRPGWGHNCVVAPFPVLIGLHCKEKYWRELISPERVYRNYKKMVRDL